MSEEAKQIPANEHPAYLRLVSELRSKGMTVESKLPANAADCEAVYCGAFLIHAGNDDWEADPDRFKNLVDNVDPSKHCCRIKPGWSPYRPDLLLLGYDVWKDAGVE